uniref:Actin-related protein 4 n=1 Tax=Salix viminalis TaxID=40686 RepID=A0A6N2LGS1_SALVM
MQTGQLKLELIDSRFQIFYSIHPWFRQFLVWKILWRLLLMLEACRKCINKCDVDIRRELYSSILLAGGTASMQQLKERLEKDLLEESPQAARVKVLASGNATERRFSVWIGGSILASLGSFQQTWFSKSEYEEHGVSYVQRKCP